MTFRESVEGIPNNTNNNISLPRSKRRKISIDPSAESALPSINKNAEPIKFNEIINQGFFHCTIFGCFSESGIQSIKLFQFLVVGL